MLLKKKKQKKKQKNNNPRLLLWFITFERRMGFFFLPGQIGGHRRKKKKKRTVTPRNSHVIGQSSRDPSLGLKTLFARAVSTVISSISPPLHFQTAPLVKLAALCYCGPTEHVPIMLRAIALRDSTCSESTLLNALRQDYIGFFLFFFICLFILFYFHDFFLLCCWVATAFKNNQSLYSFRKLDWFCE